MLANPAQIISYNLFSVYNSLSAAIQLYMIRALVSELIECKQIVNRGRSSTNVNNQTCGMW